MSSLSACKLGKLTIRGVTIIGPSCDSSTTPFGGGSGTAGDPYMICSLAQFKTIGTPPYGSSNFILKSDINYASDTAADSITGFDGVLDGNNYTIKNFTSDPVSPSGGLFNTSSGTIKKLTLDNFSVTSNTYRFGALVGYFTGTAENITLTDSVIYSDDGESEVGGFFGITSGATLTNLTATNISVSSDGHTPHGGDPDVCIALAGAGCVGGIAGAAASTNLTGCSVNGTSIVSGIRPGTGYIGGAIGGIVGSAYNSNIISSSSSAIIYGDTLLGGIAGAFQSTPTKTKIENCSTTGDVNYYFSVSPPYTPIDYDGGGAEIGLAGGAVGFLRSGEILSTSATGNVTPVTAAYMSVTMSSTLPVPEEISRIGGLIGSLNNAAAVVGGGVVNNCTASGIVEGTSEVGGLVGKAQAATITNSSTPASSLVTGTSIKIGGLVGNALDTDLSDSTSAATVTGDMYVGGLVGSYVGITRQTISNCSATGDVSSSHYAGGLVGGLNNAIVSDSHQSTGDVIVLGDVAGGLVASTYDSMIERSYSTANVTVPGNVAGGLVGEGLSLTIQDNCYHTTGTVNGDQVVGGLVGSIGTNITLSSISNSHSIGSVFSSSLRSGGLVGSAYETSIADSYSSVDITGDQITGGLVGHALQLTSISNSYSIGNVTGTVETGGLVGMIDTSSSIYQSQHSTGNVTGTDYTGGLVGRSDNGYISVSFVNATAIIGAKYVGGIVGKLQDAALNDSYANVTINADEDVGGLAGEIAQSTISYSYSSGSVSANVDNAGGIVGRATSGTMLNPADINNSFTLADVTSPTIVGGIIGTVNIGVTGIVDQSYAFQNNLIGPVPTTHAIFGAMNSFGYLLNRSFYSSTLPAEPSPGADPKALTDVTGVAGLAYLSGLGFSFGAGVWKNQGAAPTQLPYFDWMP